MTIILIIYLMVSIFGIRYRKDKSEYISKYSTTCIKGIFTVMILLSHFRGYVDLDKASIFSKFITLFGQLMVAIFFFYSGYGIFESIKNKKNYMKSFMKNRFLKTLLHFDIAIILYIILSIILNTKYSLFRYIFSFIGWTSIGNSNWFVFVILLLYLITYLCYVLFKNKSREMIISISIVSILSIIVLYFVKESWWYNIIMCYPVGMIYSYFKDKIEINILKKYSVLSLVLLIISFIVLYKFKRNIAIYELLSVTFCLLIINLSYVFKIGNKILYFLGIYSFEIYILQRIPYSIFKGVFSNEVVYFIISLVCVIIISVIFKKITNIIDNYLFKLREGR